jgi:uroporphyrinogen-III synthase
MCPDGPMSEVSLRAGGAGCGAIPTLLGHTVALTGDRRSDELAAHLRALGAEVLHGPMVRTRPVADDDRLLRRATRAVLADPPDYLLATTGIGIRGWINAAASWRARSELIGTLTRSRILARGPKVVGALSEAGLSAWHVAESGRTAALVDHLLATSVSGAHVAVQRPGDTMDATVSALEAAGARVTTIPVYEWRSPEDLDPARRVLRAIALGRTSAVTFTSRPAVRQFVALATEEGVDARVARALRRHVLSVCIGAATADALRELTGASPCCPDRAVLGALGPVVADELRTRGHHHLRVPDSGDVVVQGRLVDGRGRAVMTSDREGAVLNLLISGRIRTVSRAEISRSVWHGEVVSPSILDNTIVRLRRRIEGTGLAVLTIPGRGYLLNAEVTSCPAGVGPADVLGTAGRAMTADPAPALALPHI